MSDNEFAPDRFEPKWQKYWEEQGLFEADNDPEDREPYYALVMFPYPSGQLHVGHGRNYILADALVRYKMMRGYEVLSPMGWDAFGLPAENAAIDRDVHPREWTMENIETIRSQLKRWGLGYDWSREVTSCQPDYYRWTQWLFLQMYHEGLAYRDREQVNWCEECRTVLANEQVVDDACERCGSPVTNKDLEQWFLGITEYARDLLDDLEKLDEWPEEVREMQKNWIGRSEGAEISFEVTDSDRVLDCFTTRSDTLYGVTYVVLAPEHPAVGELAERSDRTEDVRSFLEELRAEDRQSGGESEVEKRGMPLDATAVNPVNGKEVPIWVANYAMMEYGTGAVMAVPAHDQRDFEFARRYDIDIQPVICPPDVEEQELTPLEEAYEGEGILVNSAEFNGLESSEARKKITEHLEESGTGYGTVQYRLQDWLISRQRYWGTPIPIVYCDTCGVVPVPEDELPVELPEVSDFEPTGESPLARSDAFVNTTCPECGGNARRETDTMDTFVDSTWYYLRYISPDRDDVPWDRDDVNRWLPVDKYIGGVEHAVLHLLYARFVTKFLNDIGRVDFDEPFGSLFTQGMIYREAHRCPECRSWVSPEDLEEGEEDEHIHVECGTPVESETTKMSKSKSNTISPENLISRYGADVERLYTLFMAPPGKDAEWDDEAISGCDRFLRRLWRLVHERKDVIKKGGLETPDPEELDDPYADLFREIHATIQDVTNDFENRLHPNTAIASLMELVNKIQNVEVPSPPAGPNLQCIRLALESTIQLIAPFAPHAAEELWQELGRSPSIFDSEWPRYVEKYTQAEKIEIAIQIDGTVRSKLHVSPDISEEELKRDVLEDERVQEELEGNDPERMIVVPEKLVNVVT